MAQVSAATFAITEPFDVIEEIDLCFLPRFEGVPLRTGTFWWAHSTNLASEHSMAWRRREVLHSKPALLGPDFGPDFSVAGAGSGSV